MISESAVKAFRDRNLATYEFMKNEPDWALSEALQALKLPKDFFKTTPFKHQKACFLIGAYTPSFLYFLDMGLGKSKLVLDVLAYHKMKEGIHRCLILVPQRANVDSWMSEFKTHRPDLTYQELTGTSKQRLKQLEEAQGCVVTTYASFVRIFSTKVQGKKGLQIDNKTIDKIARTYEAIVFDESQALKNWDSMTHKIAARFCTTIKYKYALTGTPIGRDPMDFWGQFRIIDNGETLGRTLGIYRSAFFKTKRNHWGGFEYSINERNKVALYKTIQNRSIRYSETDCLDLPEKVYNQVRVRFNEDATVEYEKIIDTMKALTSKDYKELQNVFINMRQLSSGYITLRPDEGSSITLDFPTNPKIEALQTLIEEMPAASKMVVFYEFNNTGENIERMLEKEFGTKPKIYERLWSGTKDVSATINRFNHDDNCRVLVANHKSGGTGVNLQIANYVVFVESPVSSIVRAQAEKRCHRSGQKANRVFYYDIIMDKSIDEKILQYIKEGKDLFRALVEGKEKLNAF